MKIVNRVEWSYPFDCAGCSSSLEAERGDIGYSSYEDGSNFWVDCPICGDRHEIEDEVVPSGVAAEARSRYYAKR